MNAPIRQYGNGLATLVIISLPIIYLLFIWESIPAEVPLRWTMQGESYHLVPKTRLWWIPFLFPVLSAIILTVAPLVAKNKAEEKVIGRVKLGYLFFLSILSISIIYLARTNTPPSESLYLTLAGAAFALVGYLLRFINPNYFVGFRTPWTLNNQEVWKETHTISSVSWIICGITISIISLFFSFETTLIVAIALFAMSILVSIIFSYAWYQHLQKIKTTKN